jgi:hypothetical protein
MSTELAWFKSSYSGPNRGDCVEVALNQVETGHSGAVHVRDSKDTSGPSLRFTPSAWSAFLTFAAEHAPTA